MATSNRDVKMTLSVDALGTDKIKKLQSDIAGLAKEGKDAAPEFEALADEVGRLGEQAKAVDTLEQLAQKTDLLSARQAEARDRVNEITERLTELSTKTKTAAEAQQQAAQAFLESKSALQATANELTILRNTYDANGQRVSGYKAKVEELTRTKIEQRAALEANRAALQQANAELSDAERAESKAALAQERSERALTKTNTALQKHTQEVNDAKQAVEAFGLSSEDLAASQAAITAGLNRTGQAAADLQQKLKTATDYVEFWENALKKADEAAAQAAAGAKAASDRIASAFGAVGVRSADELRQEIQRVRDAMQVLQNESGQTGATLATSLAAGNARIKELERDLRAATGQLTAADKAASLFKNSIGQIAAGNLIADALASIVERVKEMGRAFVTSNVELESLRRGLNAVYKDTNVTAQQIDFLRQVSQTAGVSVSAISDSFKKFAASTTSANIPIAQANELFQALVVAGGNLGLSGDKVSLALDAISQSASKGVVSMEELRQQLGDALPGAFSLTAKGLGVTDAELVKLVESGNLLARDMIPALTKALQEMNGTVNGLQPTWERFKGTLTQVAQGMGDAGATNILTAALKVLAAVLGGVAVALSTVFEYLMLVPKGLAAAAAALTEGRGAWQGLADDVDAMNKRLAEQNKALLETINPTDQAAKSTAALGVNSTAAAAGVSALSASISTAATSTDLASKSWQRLGISFQEQKVNGEQSILVYDKLVKATESSNKALEARVKLAGDESASLQAATAATEGNLQAKTALLAVQENDLLALQNLNTALRAQIELYGDPGGERKKAIDENQKIIDLRAQETERTAQEVELLRTEAAQRRLNSEAYADNSARIGELAAKVNDARAAVEALTRLDAQGVDVKQALADAQRTLNASIGLYRDAVSDAAEKIRFQAREESAALELKRATAQATATGAEMQIRVNKALADAAGVSGDYSAQLYYQVKAKQAEIEVTKINIELKKLEAQAAILALEKEKEAIPVNDALREQKIKEIDLRIQLQKVKLVEAGASTELVRALEAELTAMIAGNGRRSTEASSRLENASAAEREAAAIEKVSSAKSREKLTSDGLKTNKDGSAAGSFNNMLPVDQAFAITDKLNKGTLTAEDLSAAETAFKQAQNARAYLDSMMSVSPASVSTSAITSSDALVNSTRTALERIQAMSKQSTATTKTTTKTTTAATTTTATTSTANTTRTVNINIGGNSAKITLASQQDSDALVALLRNLESASGRTV